MNHAHGHGHAHAHDERAGLDLLSQEAWDERYRARPALWSSEPNAQLVAECATLEPGTALDAGCGEGADALWLAERGWRVTAADFAATALQRGAARAAEVGLADRITWVRADLTRWTPSEHYDLVSAQFVHLPATPQLSQFVRLAEAVAPGGTLLVVGHDPSDLERGLRRPPIPGLLFTADEVAALLDDRWTIEVAEARARPATDPEGREVTAHDAVLRARRAA